MSFALSNGGMQPKRIGNETTGTAVEHRISPGRAPPWMSRKMPRSCTCFVCSKNASSSISKASSAAARGSSTGARCLLGTISCRGGALTAAPPAARRAAADGAAGAPAYSILKRPRVGGDTGGASGGISSSSFTTSTSSLTALTLVTFLRVLRGLTGGCLLAALTART